MGKSDPEQPQSPRKKTLNIIYFVDSSRTRSLKIPLGRAQLTLFLALGTMVWAVGSAMLLAQAHKDNDGLTRSLRASMATVFEYETRYDGVYEIAYPGKGAQGDEALIAAASPEREAKEKAEINAAAAEAAKEVLAADSTEPVPVAKERETPASRAAAKEAARLAAKEAAKELAAQKALAKEEAAREAAAQKLAAKEAAKEAAKMAAEEKLAAKEAAAEAAKDAALQKLAAKAPPVEAPEAAAAAPAGEKSQVSVGNPVIQTAADSLQLNFDLTNRSSDRAEGYIWAVAAFKNDKGEISYIADPPSIGVKPDGEPSELLKSSNFGIRKFKKMSFSFPVAKEQAGTFTGIKIGVTDKTGAHRMTYNVPVEIKIGSGTR